jgi:hypothetical protein
MNPFEAILERIEQSHLSVIPMNSDAAIAVSDSPAKCGLRTVDGKPYGVLFISSSVNPDLMKRSHDCSDAVREKIGSPLNSPILKPLYTGEHEGLSYVVWPWQNPLSQNRLVRSIRKKTLVPSVVSWLLEITAQTKQAVDSEVRMNLYGDSFRFMDTLLPQLNVDRGLVELNRQFVGDTHWMPSTVVMHGDFWLDNILLSPDDTAINPYGFTVIDWAGGMLEGHPLYDLVRFMESAGTKPSQMNRWLNDYKTVMECENKDLYGYLFASLGYLGTHLEEFPEERYRLLVGRMLGLMDKAGIDF